MRTKKQRLEFGGKTATYRKGIVVRRVNVDCRDGADRIGVEIDAAVSYVIHSNATHLRLNPGAHPISENVQN
jgi:hypothetical protein